MKLILMVLLTILGFTTGFLIGRKNPIYYDGEGNIISNKAVNLLVDSQFIKINDTERDYLDSVFYGTKH